MTSIATKTTRTTRRPNSPKSGTTASRRSEPSKQTPPVVRSGRAKAPKQTLPPTPVPPVVTSKKRTIEALLRGPEGIGMAELIAATGWQAHSVRAALTGFRKAGCTIERDRNEGGTRYRIVGAA